MVQRIFHQIIFRLTNILIGITVFVEVYVNGALVEPQTELSCAVGKSLLLGMRVHNSLSWSLVDLELSTQFFQDHQNGIINYQLDTRIATAGATQIQLPKVKFIM